jgi:hypothetical protein
MPPRKKASATATTSTRPTRASTRKPLTASTKRARANSDGEEDAPATKKVKGNDDAQDQGTCMLLTRRSSRNKKLTLLSAMTKMFRKGLLMMSLRKWYFTMLQCNLC